MASGSFAEYQVKSNDFEPLAESVMTEDPADSDNLSESSEESDRESDGRGHKGNTDW